MQDFAVPWIPNFKFSRPFPPNILSHYKMKTRGSPLGNPVHCCKSVKNEIRFALTTRKPRYKKLSCTPPPHQKDSLRSTLVHRAVYLILLFFMVGAVNTLISRCHVNRDALASKPTMLPTWLICDDKLRNTG